MVCNLILKNYYCHVIHTTVIELKPQNPLELIKLQREMEEKVVSIWSVLSAFEGIFFKKKMSIRKKELIKNG